MTIGRSVLVKVILVSSENISGIRKNIIGENHLQRKYVNSLKNVAKKYSQSTLE